METEITDKTKQKRKWVIKNLENELEKGRETERKEEEKKRERKEGERRKYLSNGFATKNGFEEMYMMLLTSVHCKNTKQKPINSVVLTKFVFH